MPKLGMSFLLLFLSGLCFGSASVWARDLTPGELQDRCAKGGLYLAAFDHFEDQLDEIDDGLAHLVGKRGVENAQSEVRRLRLFNRIARPDFLYSLEEDCAAEDIDMGTEAYECYRDPQCDVRRFQTEDSPIGRQAFVYVNQLDETVTYLQARLAKVTP